MIKDGTKAGQARAGLVLNRSTINNAAFQDMADASTKELKKIGAGLVKEVTNKAPKAKRRSKNSKLYGRIKSAKTKLAAAGRREKKFKDGKRAWSFVTERIVLRTPFYAYMIDKGWNAATGPRTKVEKGKGYRARKRAQKWDRASKGGGVFVKGTGFITDTIRKRAAG